MPKPSIYFHLEEIKFVLPNKKLVRKWIISNSCSEKKEVGDINIIFTSDKYLYELNVRHLNHNTLTDIITFDYSVENEINGDIFISLDRVKENAKEFGIPTLNELHRVIIHGVLHLIGYKDKTKHQKLEMRAKEDYYLSLLPEIMKNS